MDTQTVFIVASIIIVCALIYSLTRWWAIRGKVSTIAKTAAGLFVVCFALYAVGQSLVIIQVLGYLRGLGDVSSYLYALAAILFAVGSYYQYKSLLSVQNGASRRREGNSV
jgi:hypothetical protein